jgi:transposase
MSKNKKWSAAAKFEIVLQAIKNETPLNEICKKYEVAPGQVHAWKKQFLEQGSQVFNKVDKTAKLMTEYEESTKVLYEKVGQLTIERDYLKKCWSKLHGSSDNN